MRMHLYSQLSTLYSVKLQELCKMSTSMVVKQQVAAGSAQDADVKLSPFASKKGANMVNKLAMSGNCPTVNTAAAKQMKFGAGQVVTGVNAMVNAAARVDLSKVKDADSADQEILRARLRLAQTVAVQQAYTMHAATVAAARTEKAVNNRMKKLTLE